MGIVKRMHVDNKTIQRGMLNDHLLSGSLDAFLLEKLS
jgi:hypothetical protein